MQKTTCSYLTGRYLDRISFVRRMINLLTRVRSSARHSSPFFRSVSVPAASRPRRIGSSYFFRKSLRVPRRLGLAKLSSEKYSERSFWIGVPERMTRRSTLRPLSAVKVWLSPFLSRCPSSQSRSPIGVFLSSSTLSLRVSYETIRTGRTTALPLAIDHCRS